MESAVRQLAKELAKELRHGNNDTEKPVLHDIYTGKIQPWANKPARSEGRNELNNKIEAEERYFEGKLSPEDGKRFKEYYSLYLELASHLELDAFSHGFRLAARLMIDVFTNPLHTPGQ